MNAVYMANTASSHSAYNCDMSYHIARALNCQVQAKNLSFFSYSSVADDADDDADEHSCILLTSTFFLTLFWLK